MLPSAKIPLSIRNADYVNCFKRLLKTHFLTIPSTSALSGLGFHCDNLHSCYTMQLFTFVIVYRYPVHYHEHVFYSFCKAPRSLRALGAI